MAVLKSPRQTRNKLKWAQRYVKRQHLSYVKFEDRRDPRARHNFSLFFQNYAYWVINTRFVQPRLLIRTEPNPSLKLRQNMYLSYGKRGFDTSRTAPLIARDALNVKRSTTRRRLALNLALSHSWSC